MRRGRQKKALAIAADMPAFGLAEHKMRAMLAAGCALPSRFERVQQFLQSVNCAYSSQGIMPTHLLAACQRLLFDFELDFGRGNK